MGPLATADRYWQTLRWLKPVQFYGRLWFRFFRPNPDTRPAPPRRAKDGLWVEPARRRPSLVGPGQFMFLNRSAELGACGWDNPAFDKLWRYNQHYFDDLTAQDACSRNAWHQSLMDHWITHNPPGKGSGWEPYPTSLRIVNWIKWALAGNELSDRATQSLAVQARWVRQRLEWHLLGNHLYSNAKALVFAGLFFEGPEAEEWQAKGLRILSTETAEQILPDGGQFELSPMYHALALEDVLDLINLGLCYLGRLSPSAAQFHRVLADQVPSMRRWLSAMSHPDGRIAFFNDAAFGIAPANEELDAYATRLGFAPIAQHDPQVWLEDSGYVRLSNADAVLIADLAAVGPDYLPGHAHADTLSFEFSLFGRRLFVNSGTSVYGAGEERHRQRGTAAHNTVVIDGRNSSDVWSGFRVGRRARPYGRKVYHQDGALRAEASHDGYGRGAGRAEHRRCWQLSENGLTIEDQVSGGVASAEARFHLHPDVIVDLAGDDLATLILPGGRTAQLRARGGAIRLEEASWHPEFGAGLPSHCLVVPLRNGRSDLTVTWP